MPQLHEHLSTSIYLLQQLAAAATAAACSSCNFHSLLKSQLAQVAAAVVAAITCSSRNSHSLQNFKLLLLYMHFQASPSLHNTLCTFIPDCLFITKIRQTFRHFRIQPLKISDHDNGK